MTEGLPPQSQRRPDPRSTAAQIQKSFNKSVREDNQARATIREFRRASAGSSAPAEANVREISDDEEEIALDPSPPPSPGSLARNTIAGMSSAELLDFLAKRKPEASPEDKPPPKRFEAEWEPEEILVPGQSSEPVFHSLLVELFQRKQYPPLVLFTNSNLRIINTYASSLLLTKLNPDPSVPGDKGAKVLDTANFEAKYGKEVDMCKDDWSEAALNFLKFFTHIGKPDWYKRFFAHFEFFDTREYKKENFEAIKATDIEQRVRYFTKRFVFDLRQYEKRAEIAASRPATPLLPSAPIQSRPPRSNQQGAQTSSASSRSFPSGTGGTARALVCFRCARRGHVVVKCNSTNLADGSAFVCSVKDGQILDPAGNVVCRSWNASSKRCDKKHGFRHCCAFCSSTEHGAFDWNFLYDQAESFLNSLPFRPPPNPNPQPLSPTLPSFSPPTESLSPEFAEIRMRVVCPYDVDELEAALKRHGLEAAHTGLADDMRQGFRMGDFPELAETVIFPNDKTVETHKQFVADYLDAEVDAGRMSGPFTEEETRQIVGGHFQCSPMIVAEQTQEMGKPNKLRLCRHLSKRNASHPATNDYIDKEDFPTRFGTAAEVAEIVANAPEGTEAMTLDIAKFHRTCPIRPEHKRYFVVQDDRGFFIEHNCPFGCSSSSSNAGRISNAVMDVARAEGINPSNKYEDDIMACRVPTGKIPEDGGTPRGYEYDYDEAEVLRRLAPIRVPWHPLEDKGQGFAPRATYIGFEWSFPDKSVRLPEKKRVKFLRRSIDFANKKTYTKQDVDKIHGSLCHIAYVYPAGRSYLAALSNEIVSFERNPRNTHHHPSSVETAMKWWIKTLAVPNVPRSLVPRGEAQEIWMYGDASTDWGVGIYWDGKWDAFRTREGWKSKQRHITWLEAMPPTHNQRLGRRRIQERPPARVLGQPGSYWGFQEG
ncbi:Reverse transcriptase/ribonuclease H [Mycena kentingensis (nom. inval.)]|nr:Reverse transcriptase/ribonuclease H [Mycena kentingensis (nom. inval.)]